MAKTADIRLADGTRLAILYEDRAVLAVDKPPGWLLAPNTWTRTARNLQLALESGLRGAAFWARCRNLRFLRFVHRLDAETSGVLLLAKSPGALRAFSELFAGRGVEKDYLVVVQGVPAHREWTCSLPIGRDAHTPGRMKVRGADARAALTHFRVLEAATDCALVLARPVTGRTHQIRVHLAAGGHPVFGDSLYGAVDDAGRGLALRAVRVAYVDPFQKRPVQIQAPWEEFVSGFGFTATAGSVRPERRL